MTNQEQKKILVSVQKPKGVQVEVQVKICVPVGDSALGKPKLCVVSG